MDCSDSISQFRILTSRVMKKELDKILVKLREANTNKDTLLIEKHVNELNKLWEENEIEIIKNGGKDGFNLPKKTNNEN